MTQQKNILIFLVLFILVSFSFLAISENKQHQIKNSWFIYFDNIDDKSLNFTIENYLDDETYSWELFYNEKSIKKEPLLILKGNKKNVIVSEHPEKGRAEIRVYHDKETKRIYKDFE